MRLASILNEGRSQQISLKRALDILDKKCQQSIHQNWRIYRGVNTNYDIYYVDPRGKERFSSYAQHNYYNLFLSNAGSWEKYPKRNQSLVGSTKNNDASPFGEVFLLFPEDGAKIGVCPMRDIWDSFYNVALPFDALNEYIDILVGAANEDEPRTWQQMLNVFESIDNQKDQIETKLINSSSIYTFFTHKVKYFRKNVTLLQALEIALAPAKNNFVLSKTGNQIPSNINNDGNEVWTDSPAIMYPTLPQDLDILIKRYGITL